MPKKGSVFPERIAGRIATGAVVLLVAASIAVLLSADSVLNGVVKGRILREANSRKGISLSLGAIHYHLLSNRITCDQFRLSIGSNGPAGNTVDLAANALSCSDVNWLRMLLGDGIQCGAVDVDGLRGRIVSTENAVSVRGQSQERQPERRDGYHRLLPLIIGRLSVQGGAVSRTLRSQEETFRDSVSRFVLEIRDLRLDSLSIEHLASSLSRGHIECRLEQAGFRFPGSPYQIGFASARVSDAESLARFDSLEFSPVVPDEKFFASDHRGLTRFKVSMERLDVSGFGVGELLGGKRDIARRIGISRPDIDIVVNKRASGNRQSQASPDSARMPNEILADLNRTLRVDTLSVTEGRIEYAELFPSNSRPAALRWSGVRVTATGISNQRFAIDTVARIKASGMFQDTARMVVNMTLPLATKDFSLSCHGILDSLPLPSLNSFLEVAEGIRITSGRADSVSFAFNAAHGKSSGVVRPIYHDLEIEMLAKETGRSDGIPQKVGTLLADIKIKDDNLPEGSGTAREGRVQYARKPDDPFFKFVWFSLRGGLGSVVGF